jgi:hypothetical protein
MSKDPPFLSDVMIFFPPFRGPYSIYLAPNVFAFIFSLFFVCNLPFIFSFYLDLFLSYLFFDIFLILLFSFIKFFPKSTSADFSLLGEG